MLVKHALLVTLQIALGAASPLPAPTAPPGVSVELRTVGNKTTFRLSEVVPLEVAFRVTGDVVYSIEIADGWHPAPNADRFIVEPGHNVINRNVWLLQGITCCDSRRSRLSSAPAVYPYELTDLVRFTEPGEYRIQYTTRRVFAGPPVTGYNESPIRISSNILTIRIIPDDPHWLEALLPGALKGADPTPVNEEFRAFRALPARGSLEPPAASAAMVRYRRATRQLRLLDTPAAIRARVSRLRTSTVDEWRRHEASGNGYSLVDDSVAYSSRPDLVAAALGARAADADFGLMRGYFELWTNVVLERDHPELVRLGRTGRIGRPASAAELRRVTQATLLATLRELARSKTRMAAEITAATIRSVERDWAR